MKIKRILAIVLVPLFLMVTGIRIQAEKVATLKEIKRVFVPCPDMPGMDFYPKYYYYKRAFYSLVENPEEEVWELHRSDVIK